MMMTARLKEAVGPKGFSTDPGEIAPHLEEWRGKYRGRSALLLKPASTAEFSAILAICHETGTAIVTRSGGGAMTFTEAEERPFETIMSGPVAGAEGAGELFRVTTLDPSHPPMTEEGDVDFKKDFFGKKSYLTVSGQLEGEIFACALGNIYTFGPTFRAENSNTSRHAAEFWMIEPEMAFCDLGGNMALAEDFVKYLIRDARQHCAADLEFFSKFVDKDLLTRLDFVLERPFQRCSYTEAIEILNASGRQWEHPVKWGDNLQSEHERCLTEEIVGRPVVVMNYPKDIKAFYMRMNEDGRTVAAMDVLAPGIGEIIGGSQREERLDVLDARIKAMGLDPAAYGWYRDLRRYGSVPHAGFGIGVERTLAWIAGLDHVRESAAFARMLYRLTP